MLFKIPPKKVPIILKKIIESDIFIEEQDAFRNRLESKWADVTKILTKEIEKYGEKEKM